MRLLVASTTPPTACEPKRSASGPRKISIFCTDSGSIGTPWSWPRSETSMEPMPFSCTRTRKSSSPRSTGRDAPGAIPADVAPGRVKNRLPKLWAGFA